MSFVIFMPWATVAEESRVGEFIFWPVKCNERAREGLVQAEGAVARVLSAYHDLCERPISSATQIRVDGRDPLADISQDDLDDLFTVGEVVAFGGLAARDTRKSFRGFASEYSNRDSFRVIAQGFKPDDVAPAVGASVVVRRRGSATFMAFQSKVWIQRQPDHVEELASFHIDEALCAAVLRRMDDDAGFDQAIRLFNSANTDRSDTSEASEVIDVVSAFQRLFDTGSACEEVAERLEDLLASSCAKAALPAEFPHRKYASRPLAGWLFDLCTLRGNVGHGHRAEKYKRQWWKTQTHLVLASIIFPLAVKLVLQRAKKLTLTEEDERRIGWIDHLLKERDLYATVAGNPDEPWAKEMGWDRAMKSVV
jgi:hypothetical protein